MTPIPSYLCPSPELLSLRITAERKRLELTQRQAASILGVGLKTYQRFEFGTTHPRLSTFFALIEALEMEPKALLPELFAAVDRAKLRA
jgi:transcriptional regulator with XRE-family HTH domain